MPIEIDAELPRTLTSSVCAILREYFRQEDPTIGLRDLILMAEESGTLDSQGLEMVRILQRQSELIDQDDLGISEDSTARIMLSLYAAAMLWPRLPKAGLVPNDG